MLLGRSTLILLCGCGSLLAIDDSPPPRGDAGTSSNADGGTSFSVAAPPSVTEVSATDRDQGASLTFTTLGAASSHEYSFTDPPEWKPLAEDHVVSGLTNGESYRFVIRALTAVGPGPQSVPSNAVVPYGAPSVPVLTFGRSMGFNLQATWTPSTGNGRNVIAYEFVIDTSRKTRTAATQFSTTASDYEPVQFCVRAISDGADPLRAMSVDACKSAAIPAPTVAAENNGNAFQSAGAGGDVYSGEVKANRTYEIMGACKRDPDIGTNNGWWYRLRETKHWAAATLFAKSQNEFNARRITSGDCS